MGTTTTPVPHHPVLDLIARPWELLSGHNTKITNLHFQPWEGGGTVNIHHVLIKILFVCCTPEIWERSLVLWCHPSVGVWARLFILFSVSYVGERRVILGQCCDKPDLL